MPDDGPARRKRPRPLFTGYGHKVTARQRADWKCWADQRAQLSYRRGTEAALSGDYSQAITWLDRAARMAPDDLNVAAARAFAYFAAGDWAAACVQLGKLVDITASPRVLAALAVTWLRLRRIDQACAVTEALLSRNAPPPEIYPTADLVRRHVNKVGWCGVSNAGILIGQSDAPVSIKLDDHFIAQNVSLPFALPEKWVAATHLEVLADDKPLLGAPIDLQAIRQTEGFVTCKNGKLEGWIWYPHDPETPAEILIKCAGHAHRILPQEDAGDMNRYAIFRAARRFTFPMKSIPRDARIDVTDRYGRHLMGSPVTPALRALLETRPPRVSSGDAQLSAPSPRAGAPKRREACLVIIPVYRGLAESRACLNSVLDARTDDLEILVINDATPDPQLREALHLLAASGDITLLTHEENLGFVASVNAGLEQAAGRDVILLNNDAMFFNDGVRRLRAALHSAADIGTATPFSNHATIFSLPYVDKPNPFPSPAHGAFLDRILSESAFAPGLDVPTAHGFCMAIKGACLEETGLFRDALFAQGYGEENDFCLRAADHGWRHIAATRVYVAHHGSLSFNGARDDLLARNLKLVEKLHPGYLAAIDAFIEKDPLAAFRNDVIARAIKATWREAPHRTAILVTHDAGGGVERIVKDRAQWFQDQGLATLVIRPHYEGCRLSRFGGDDGEVIFRLPEGWGDLVAFLKEMSPALVEIHHMVGHAAIMHQLPRALAVSSDIYVHDYAWFCPRVTLLSDKSRYCGEPDLESCQKCVDRLGDLTGENLPVAARVARSDALLREARRVVAPCHDTATRMMRHFDTVPVIVMSPSDLPATPNRRVPRRVRGAAVRICVVGAIGKDKGYDVLLALARYAQRTHRALDILVIGHSVDDDRLLATGKVHVTGEYKNNEEALSLIEAFQPHWGFLPSIWPETWCFALSLLMAKISRIAVFDIGAQAERMRRVHGSVILPLGMNVSRLADMFHPPSEGALDEGRKLPEIGGK
ncbi:glycosyltransferase [Candidatus Kirkpatrickella diaphorinae]|uniref:Glycosyltransferase n=1 Tax=Candidatus Kirkpatrickella diaphorinae TaxID=2984322 RepID=A0ABY6GLA2_9PROT|nr:glycosyltransferase [Candidatus Kirkpatrickella diaphorinae]UYH52312.1 glycosyltransferase [Candidatus Kirkpatrickella diaphorinae]